MTHSAGIGWSISAVYPDLMAKSEEKRSFPFGGVEFYIDYKSLSMDDFNKLFEAINRVYHSIYQIEYAVYEPAVAEDIIEFHLPDFLKIYPEDALQIHSIDTGNSINFKLSTGWKPKVELIRGDFVISLPKGSVALLITAFALGNIVGFGLSEYKQLLEIMKLQKEIDTVTPPPLADELKLFDERYEKVPDALKMNFQNNLSDFYQLTVGNSRFIHVKVKQDTVIRSKMNDGNVVIPPVKTR